MTFSTPENLKLKNVKGFGRERLNSAPDRLRKSKEENVDIRSREKILLETRQLSDLRINKLYDDEIHFAQDVTNRPDITKGRFKCHICTKRFHHSQALEAHYFVHSTTDLNEEPKETKCKICGKNCSSKIKLRIHQNKRHPTGNPEILGVF